MSTWRQSRRRPGSPCMDRQQGLRGAAAIAAQPRQQPHSNSTAGMRDPAKQCTVKPGAYPEASSLRQTRERHRAGSGSSLPAEAHTAVVCPQRHTERQQSARRGTQRFWQESARGTQRQPGSAGGSEREKQAPHRWAARSAKAVAGQLEPRAVNAMAAGQQHAHLHVSRCAASQQQAQGWSAISACSHPAAPQDDQP